MEIKSNWFFQVFFLMLKSPTFSLSKIEFTKDAKSVNQLFPEKFHGDFGGDWVREFAPFKCPFFKFELRHPKDPE